MEHLATMKKNEKAVDLQTIGKPINTQNRE